MKDNELLTINIGRKYYVIAFLLIVIALTQSLNHIDSWIFTQWLFNYEDGFVKRGLVGELVNSVFSHLTTDVVEILSYLILIAILALLSAVYLRPFLRDKSSMGLWLFFVLAVTHSATLQHFAFDLGRYDGLLLVLMMLATFAIRSLQGIRRIMTVCVISTLGIVTHEGFFFICIPYILGYWCYSESEIRPEPSKTLVVAWAIMCTYLVATKGVFNSNDFLIYSVKLSDNYGDLVNFDSLKVLYRGGVEENITNTIAATLSLRRLADHVVLFVVMLPLMILVWPLLQYLYRQHTIAIFFIATSLGPILLYPLGTDHFRWWALAVTNFLICISVVMIENNEFRRISAAHFLEKKKLIYSIIALSLAIGPMKVSSSFGFAKLFW